jgi:hypothetical protein
VAIVASRFPGSVVLTPGSVALTPGSLVSVYREFNNHHHHLITVIKNLGSRLYTLPTKSA